jgi:small-conductance mechanosensitive channel
MLPERAQEFDITPVAERLLDELYRLIATLPLLGLAVVAIALAWWMGGWISRRAVLDRVARSNPFLRDLARTTVRWLVLLVGILAALEIMDATALVGAVLGTAGVLGVALGFAFKDILENYLAGILMSTRQPFAPHDHVVIDGNEGVIVSLNSRATVLMTLDGNHIRLPNALVFRSVILNYTRNPSRRFQVEVGIGVEEDLVRAQRIGVDELQRLPGVLHDPPPRSLIVALGDSNVQMHFHAWVDQRTHDFARVRSEGIRRVKLALEDAGMDMPEPIYRVQLTDRTTSGGEARPPRPRHPHDGAAIDTAAQRDISRKIEEERSAGDSTDLLSPAAPRE